MPNIVDCSKRHGLSYCNNEAERSIRYTVRLLRKGLESSVQNSRNLSMTKGQTLYVKTAREWLHSNKTYWGQLWGSLPEWRQHLWEVMAGESNG